MKVGDLDGLAEAEAVNVDDHAFGDFGVNGLHAELLHGEGELTTGFHTFGMAFDLHGHLDGHGLLVVYLKKVDVKDGVLYGVELDVLENGHALAAVNIKFDSEDVGSIDELAYCVLSNSEVGCDEAFAVADLHYFLALFEGAGVGEVKNFAAVENHGDLVFFAKGFGCLLSESRTGFGCKLECFHWMIIVKCVTKN